MSAEGFYLTASVINAQSIDTAEVIWEVASQTTDGDWFTNDGQQLWPFYTEPINNPTPIIPDGWIDHLHDLARRRVCAKPAPSLLDRLNLRPTQPPIVRRI